MLLRYLMAVHRRQWEDLCCPDIKEVPESSFYFDSLTYPGMVEWARLATHLISYERGRMRYEKLKTTGNQIWALLERDACCNRDACLACLQIVAPVKFPRFITGAIKREKELMKKIDERNSQKA